MFDYSYSRSDERFVENQGGSLDARIQIAVAPLVGRLAHRHFALLVVLEVFFGPLDLNDIEGRRSRGPHKLARRAGDAGGRGQPAYASRYYRRGARSDRLAAG